MTTRFFLRRSLCALLVAVTATAFSQAPNYYVDVTAYNSRLGTLVDTLAQNTTTELEFWNTLVVYLEAINSGNIGATQNLSDLCSVASNILSRCETISDYDMTQVAYMRNDLVPKLADCRSFLLSLVDYSSSLYSDLSALKQQLQGANFTNDLSGITSDIEDVSQNIQSLVSLFTSFGNSLSSIETTLSTFDNVTSNTFASAFSELFGKFDALPDNDFLNTKVSSIVGAINNLSDGLSNTVQIDGEVDVSSSSFGPVVTALGRVRQAIFDFYSYWEVWCGDTEHGEHSAMSWGTFTTYMQDFFLNFSTHLAYQGQIYALLQELNTNYNDYNTFYTNSLSTYLPFLTNQNDAATFVWLTNQIYNTPLVSFDPYWQQSYSQFPLSQIIGRLLAYNSVGAFSAWGSGPGNLFRVPLSSTSSGSLRNFFTRGLFSATPDENQAGSLNPSLMDQRRWIYQISNTVPYIEGLPYRKASLSETGDGWLGAWGNYNWNTDGDTISLVEDSRNGGHTPWNNNYFSTDYFADLLKFIARTNLLQDAAYYNSMLALFGATNTLSSEEIEQPDDLEWTEPTDVQAQIDELPDADSILPTDFTSIESREYDAFASDASSKLRVALDNPVSQISDSFVLFPSVPSIRSYSAAVGSPQLLHFEDYMTASDRRTIHDIFAIMWRLIYYVFAVWKVTDLIKSFFAST